MPIRIIFPVVAWVLLLSHGAASAEICQCAGQQLNFFSGGDRRLDWHFAAYLVRPGGADFPPLACYEKLVRNSDKKEVRNIKWDVANYRRRILFNVDKACPTLPGEVSPVPKFGPLHYGVSSEFYETIVLPPRDGWLQKSA